MILSNFTSLMQRGAILLLLVLLLLPAVSTGTWNILLNDYFESAPANWPWGQWAIRNANPSWGIQSTYYNVGIGNQAVWIMGYPYPSTLDPEFDNYTPNFYTYMYWGPFSLANAEDARCSFQLLNRVAIYDSIWWGACTSGPTNYNNYYIGGSDRSVMNGFELRTYSLSELDSAGQTISLCGRPTVWIGFFFRADGNGSVNMGSIVDDCILAWDDGMYDLVAMFMDFTTPDSIPYVFDPVAGDTVLFKLQYFTAGNDSTPEYDLECSLNDSVVYSDRRTSIGETTTTLYSDPWVVEPGDWVIRWSLDTKDEVIETNENNNDIEDSIHVDVPNTPPSIVILTPPAGGAVADNSYLITWVDEDPDDNALIYIFYDDDSLGFNGTILPGGNGIEENSPADSLRWNTTNIPDGDYWIWARIADPYTSNQIYSAGPVMVAHFAVPSDNFTGSPTEFSLESIYPNPFNATATLTFGVPFQTQLRLEVFNLLGQRVAEVINGDVTPGVHRIQWNPADLPSGVYLVRLQTPGFSQTQKVVLMK